MLCASVMQMGKISNGDLTSFSPSSRVTFAIDNFFPAMARAHVFYVIFCR
jgi:hypothetical protein